MFQKHLTAGEALLYPDFLNDLCKLIVSQLLHSQQFHVMSPMVGLQVVDFIDRVNFYLMTGVGFFKSAVPEIRSNAVLFVGERFQVLVPSLLRNKMKSIYGSNILPSLLLPLYRLSAWQYAY